MVAQINQTMARKRFSKIPGRLINWALIEGRPLTTKGQWINSLVFAGYRLAQLLPEHKGARAPIYIVGTGRSGTTVLGTLFAMHKNAVFLNEPKALWHYAHGAEDIIGSYSTSSASVRMAAEDASEAQATKIANVYSSALRAGLANRVADKYPELIFRIPFVLALFPKARFVAIIRDGVDTCSSVTGWSKRKGEQVGEQTHDWWGRDGRKWQLIVEQLVPEHADLAPLQGFLRTVTDHRDRAAVEWIISMREAKATAEAHPEVIAIKYEDLCASPEPVLDQILNHCDLPSDVVFEDYAKSVLSAADSYAPLELSPEILGPFQATLHEMGYGDSAARTQARQVEL
ncbi:sulfotransferase [Parasedimentitalea huanghaiensis]|uniref:Sulfotransferase n=1 Tax=Parasedimentitalea huanghaiensis TaxID=2682100 RepID=A0A6L6WI45_9RHOB|nr:sulfotransferase [Zongyanglinia huanghaiensis]